MYIMQFMYISDSNTCIVIRAFESVLGNDFSYNIHFEVINLRIETITRITPRMHIETCSLSIMPVALSIASQICPLQFNAIKCFKRIFASRASGDG